MHAASALLVRIRIPLGGGAPAILLALVLLVALVLVYVAIKRRREPWAKVVLAAGIALPVALGGAYGYWYVQSEREHEQRRDDYAARMYERFVQAGATAGQDLASVKLWQSLSAACVNVKPLFQPRLRELIAYVLPLPEELRRAHHAAPEPAGVMPSNVNDEVSVFKAVKPRPAAVEISSDRELVVATAVTALDAATRDARLAVRVHSTASGRPQALVCEGTVTVRVPADALAAGGDQLLRSLGAGAMSAVCSAGCSPLTLLASPH